MSFSEFKKFSQREDSKFNDLAHFFSNKPGLYLAYFLDKLNFTPNQVTLIFIFVGLLGCISLAYGYLFLSYILWRLHIILDIADGNIARKRKLFTSLGPILDKIGHHLIYPTIILSLLIYLKLPEEYPYLSLFFAIFYLVQWSTKYLNTSKKFLADHGKKTQYIFKRIVINLLGIEGIYITLFLNYFDLINKLTIIYFFLLSSIVILFIKVYIIVKNSD